jgi:hypothetical protein
MAKVQARNIIEIDTGTEKFDAYYDPNYRTRCEVCGQTPTVRIRRENGKMFYDGTMCGPCTWGEADTIDPDKW